MSDNFGWHAVTVHCVNLGSREYFIANDRAHNKLEHIIKTIYVAKKFCGGGGEGTGHSLF